MGKFFRNLEKMKKKKFDKIRGKICKTIERILRKFKKKLINFKYYLSNFGKKLSFLKKFYVNIGLPSRFLKDFS